MKEKPILFSGAMVRAILDETKTQTRRVVKQQPIGNLKHCGPCDRAYFYDDKYYEHPDYLKYGGIGTKPIIPPYGQVGDRLWVREEHYRFGHWEKVTGTKARTRTGRQKWKFVADHDEVLFDAPESFRRGRHHKDPETTAWHKRLARFMPKKFCRTRLEITDLRVERLQEISEQAARAEGAKPQFWPSERMMFGAKINYRAGYAALWESINGPGSWQQNPWVWVITFKRINP